MGESRFSGLRWTVCSLLFLATVLNYVDRQVFSILAPDLQRDIGWSELDYGRIVIAFQLSYALSYLGSGRLVDRIGTKPGYSLAVIWWSVAEMAHSLAHSFAGFGTARFFLGAGEGANFPAAMKAIAEWFPGGERGLATGIVNSAPTVGAIVAPIVVPLAAARFGWRGTFLLTGLLGLLWLVAWSLLYFQPGGSTAPVTDRISIRKLLTYRQTWAFGVGKLLADPAWFFYLFWLPKFLAQEHGLRGTAVIPYLTTVYMMCGVGSAIGGWASSALVKGGWTLNWARKVPMAVSAAIMPLVIFASQARDPWTAVLLIGVVTATHQSWSSLVFTLGTDLFPGRAVGSVTGIAGGLGSLATIVFAEFTGRVLQQDASFYLPMFIVCGFMYLVAFGVIHLLVPRLEPANL